MSLKHNKSQNPFKEESDWDGGRRWVGYQLGPAHEQRLAGRHFPTRPLRVASQRAGFSALPVVPAVWAGRRREPFCFRSFRPLVSDAGNL